MISTTTKPNGTQRKRQIPNNIIGSSAFLSGDLSTSGDVCLEGQVEGNIESKGTIVLGKSCFCKGEVRAKVIQVLGEIEGNLIASELVQLMPSAICNGFIVTPVLKTQAGSRFNGEIKMI